MRKERAVILLGGTGFIGSALATELVRRGERVVSISRNFPEKRENGIEYHAFDASSQSEKLAAVFGTGNIIFLLLGQNYSGFDTTKELDVFLKVLEAVKASVPEKIIFTSSALVYGECEIPANERHKLYPKEPYSEFKVSCEQLIQEKLTGVPVGILRLANVYGSEKNNGFIGLVFRKAADGLEIRINGDGFQERDYVFLDEVISAMISIIEKLEGTDVINVATGKSETLLDVVQAIAGVMGKEIRYEITGVPVGEVLRSRIDNTRLKEKYGVIPQIFLKEGIQKTCERYGYTKEQ